ncbi:MAG TPA: FkbM family methyltransferase [Terracidiphilus sp.]|jgi:FkbM family methyltransferase
MMRQLTLPDGLTVFSLNADETRFVHREVFDERCYLQYGIEIHEGDCIFDVGANIGLSTVFFHLQCPGVRIYAFEPSPATFECLKANVELHKVNAHLFECGLSRESGTAEFTFYPGNTVRSGFHIDLETDRKTTKTYMMNTGIAERKADLFLGLLFKKTTFPCRLRTVSEIVDEEGVTQIDLLKIDAERSEREVLAGIRDEHWGMIRQVALEVQDEEGALGEVEQLLTKHGFDVATEQDPLLKGTAVFGMFARRSQAELADPIQR